MVSISKRTLQAMLRELDGHAWRGAELDELVAPRHGIISGLQNVLDDLQAIRSLDLPGLEQGVNRRRSRR